MNDSPAHFALLVVLLLGTTACRQADDESSGERPGAEADETARVDASPTPATALTGNWTVAGHWIPGVSAMGAQEAEAWHGRHLRLEASEALTSGARCGQPDYEVESVDLDSLIATDYRLPPGSLGFPSDRDHARILRTSCEGLPWSAMGGLLIEMDEERAFAPWDGVFFELRRDRAADDVDFRAKGNEPFWSLEITEEESMRFTYALGEREAHTPVPPPVTDQATGAVVYHAVTEANDLRVRIEPAPCTDSMSGFAYETTVTVTLNGDDYSGCGGPLE